MARVFISHSSKDKEFARRLGADLADLGHAPWLDEWEIRVGECIVKGVGDGLRSADHVILVLSPESVASNWVEREWAASYWQEIQSGRRVVLPVMLHECDVPTLLQTKKYADFRRSYAVGLAQLASAIGPFVERLTQPSGSPMPPRDAELMDLISSVQGRAIALAECVARALSVARRLGNASLQTFCERELTGFYVTRASKDDPDLPTYRVIETFVSVSAEINMQYFGWGENASVVLDYMRHSPDFAPLSMVVPFPIAKLEAEVTPPNPKAIMHIVSTWGALDPTTKHPDAPLQIYARGDSHQRVLEAIRVELTRRLLAVLPRMPEPNP